MKHINLARSLPVTGALAALVYVAAASLSRNAAGGTVGVILGVVAGAVFDIQIRLGHLPWFENRERRAAPIVVWLEKRIPWLRGPRR
jgi:hypothetical protein